MLSFYNNNHKMGETQQLNLLLHCLLWGIKNKKQTTALLDHKDIA